MRTAALLVLVLSGCSGTVAVSDAGSGDASVGADVVVPGPDANNVDAPIGPSLSEACAALGDAVCSKLSQCSSFGLQLAYGDEATCKARSAKGCVVDYPSSSLTPSRATACAASLGAVECSKFLLGDLGDACNPAPGLLDNGAACIDGPQCKSTFCAKPLSDHCGMCAAPTSEGDACVNQACSRGTACSDATKKCAKPTSGKVGASCNGQEDCDLAHGVGCNTFSKKCIALALASNGKTCGADNLVAPTKFTLCEAAGTCSAITNGTCSAAAADGASCTAGASGPYCLGPSKCISSKCTLPDPSTCK